MKDWSKQLAAVVGVAAMTFSASLALLWPTETQADDEEAAVEQDDGVADNETIIGKIDATSRIVRDERLASTWYLEMKIENKDLLNPQSADVQGTILAMDLRAEMSRVPPMPKVIFKCDQSVVVAAGETAVRRCTLPAGLAKKVAAVYTKKAPPMANRAVVRGQTMYRTRVVEVVKKTQPKVQQASRS
jgi:hypothetical protein